VFLRTFSKDVSVALVRSANGRYCMKAHRAYQSNQALLPSFVAQTVLGIGSVDRKNARMAHGASEG